MRGLLGLLVAVAVALSVFSPAAAGSITIRIRESDTPLLISNKADSKSARVAEEGETFTAFVSSLYGGFYMVVDKETNSFLYIPFAAADEIVEAPEDVLVSGRFDAPATVDISEWQVMPDDAPYTDGEDFKMQKYRSKADGMLTAHNGKRFPARYSYNEDYQPRINGSKLLKDAKKFLGVPYVLGGTTLSGIDCSGLTSVCLSNQGVDVVHRASLQALEGTYVRPSDLRTGDLVFFRDDKTDRYLSHVGIYAGNGKFIHASQSAGKVAIGSLNDKYFKTHYAFARRL